MALSLHGLSFEHKHRFAGSDTTAMALRSVFYHLMKTPTALQELVAEIDDATSSGKLSTPPKYLEASMLPLLLSSIKDAMSLHPMWVLPCYALHRQRE